MIETEKEQDRLQALQRYQILDTPSEGSFDRITSLASQLLNVPVAITTLVDTDRVWFKSRHGIDLEEVKREPGLCASAILHNKPYILNDASIDPRSLAHPLVAKENGFRFYAGVPLTTHDNHNLGTLCVMDYQPRSITNEELNILNVLAQIVMDEMELRLASRNIDKLTRQKSALLAVLSHEIRTPLNGIIGMTSLLQSTEMTEEQKEFLDTIDSCGETLLSLLDHILDFSKFEAGKMELNVEPFDIHSCLNQVLDLFSAQVLKKGIIIKSELASEISHKLVGDKHKIRQVLINLVGNAVKFTKQGEIQISVNLTSEDLEYQRLSFRVKDTGIGIPNDYIDQLFQPYTQVHTKIADEYFGGTGLGLSICKQLVKLMNGRIWLENSTNRGSTFAFEIGFPLKTEDYVK
ncbi:MULTISPECIES: GAF domain-containing hybrid sensor histidine kinase/response regulator [unclassified Paenibacillus]|uniref:GAF domain-containing sensor histidine kinase n=1 Tax=unclassified Paenibacillus TaxID=185978 RepID=UPI001AEB5D54|nr:MULTISPECIES: GAF domain-containing hybrid sensor histidine kinase/response regulator [unclassified Paenibacillus]MBP1155336.1 signal transduction histidine kinase [Paenibacillus sp. PvP091]MBP1169280.1 signal transduction histidine kinase [Paenibacillus sp. PvR098]MBP2440308.1 signal transduction histidine kinase [Paenibacillus sp. PvP052]